MLFGDWLSFFKFSFYFWDINNVEVLDGVEDLMKLVDQFVEIVKLNIKLKVVQC